VWLLLSIKENGKPLSYIRFDMICAVKEGNNIGLGFRICNRLFSFEDTIQKGDIFRSGALKATHIKLEQKTRSEFVICW